MKKEITIGIIDSDEISQFVNQKVVEATHVPAKTHFISTMEEFRAAKTTAFDFLFIDLNFLNDPFFGIEVLNEFKKQHKPFISIAVSVFLREGDREKILNAGFDHCIVRPFKVDEVRDILEGTNQSKSKRFPILL